MMRGKRNMTLTCLYLSRLASEEEEVPWLVGAPESVEGWPKLKAPGLAWLLLPQPEEETPKLKAEALAWL